MSLSSIHNRLEQSLSDIRRLLPLAATRAKQDPEFVHQLRIATRKSLAALDVHASWLPSAESKSLRKQLKRIRSAAGEARDLDVLLIHVQKSKTPGRKKLIRNLLRLREHAQRPLLKIAKRVNRRQRFDTCSDVCLHAIEDASSIRGPEAIVRCIRDLAMEIARFDPCSCDDSKSLHRFRVRAKQLRYRLELMSDVDADSSLDDLHQAACDVQEKLGKMNDHTIAARRYDRIRRHAKSERFAKRMKGLVKRERTEAKIIRDQFRDWWTLEARQRFETWCESRNDVELNREASAV